MSGDLNVVWIHGAPDCAGSGDPPIQVHRFDADTFILRQSKCSEPGSSGSPGPSFEAPFMYLLIGRSRALLLDTGASRSAAVFPLAAVVGALLSDHAAAHGAQAVPLVVAHSHGHGDHMAADGQFPGMAGAVVIEPGFAPLVSAFAAHADTAGVAALGLGGRVLDLMAIPGHEDAHIALYDRNTQILLTGDTVYPGLLVVNRWEPYRESVARLALFAEDHPVSHILGAHIEMSNEPGRWFGLGAQFQPGEHVLQLSQSHLKELNAALQAIGPIPRGERHADFIIHPAGKPLPSLSP